jgi:2-alkyl-3-oxoalkanoate reductase
MPCESPARPFEKDGIMKIFVAGATGVIGRRLLPRLQNHQVTALTRSPQQAEQLKTLGVQPVVGDVFDQDRLMQAVVAAQPDIVMHQLTSIPRRIDTRNVSEAFAATNRLRAEGTRILMAAAIAAGAKQFIAQSLAAFYAPDKPSPATEDEPLYMDAHPTFASIVQALAALEDTVLNTSGIAGIVLRYGYFYGAGTAYAADGGMAASIRRQYMPIVGAGTGVFSFVRVDDAAEATVLALTRGKPGIYNIVDDDPAPISDWLPTYARLLNAPAPQHVPVPSGEIPDAERFGIFFMTQQRGASNQKAKEQLGWQPHYASWREGFRAELQPDSVQPM